MSFALKVPEYYKRTHGPDMGGSVAQDAARDDARKFVRQALMIRGAGLGGEFASVLDHATALHSREARRLYGPQGAEYVAARYVLHGAGKLAPAVLDRLTTAEWCKAFRLNPEHVTAGAAALRAVDALERAELAAANARTDLAGRLDACQRQAEASRVIAAERRAMAATARATEAERREAHAQAPTRSAKIQATKAAKKAAELAASLERQAEREEQYLAAALAEIAEAGAAGAAALAELARAEAQVQEAQGAKHRAASAARVAFEASAARANSLAEFEQQRRDGVEASTEWGQLMNASFRRAINEGEHLERHFRFTGETLGRRAGSGHGDIGGWEALDAQEHAQLDQGARDFAEAVRVREDHDAVADDQGARVAAPALAGWAAGARRTPLCIRRGGRAPVAVQVLADVSSSTADYARAIGRACSQLVRALRDAGHAAALDAWNSEGLRADDAGAVIGWQDPLAVDMYAATPSGGTVLVRSAEPRMGRLQASAPVGVRQLVVVVTDGETDADDRVRFLRRASCPCIYVCCGRGAPAPAAGEGWALVLRTDPAGMLPALTGEEVAALVITAATAQG